MGPRSDAILAPFDGAWCPMGEAAARIRAGRFDIVTTSGLTYSGHRPVPIGLG